MADAENGIAGVAPNVSIMPIKYYSESNSGAINLQNTIKALNYAIDHGARVINYSGGGPEFAQEEYNSIKRAAAAGILVVAAAGNDHNDIDKSENFYFPASYRLPNIISVAATDSDANLLSSSNWGRAHVDVAAPGEQIFSTLPNNRSGFMTGTSQATAFVSGIAAMLFAEDPTLTFTEVREIIMNSVDQMPQLKTRLLSGGKVNAFAALKSLKSRIFKGKPAIVAEVKPRSLAEVLDSQ